MAEPSESNVVIESSSSRVSVRVEDRIARFSLNNPPLNVLTLEMIEAIATGINEVAREQSLCAILFEPGPKSRAFCAGIAVDEQLPDSAYQFLEAYHGLFRDLDFYSKPTIAVVPDAALGAGCELAAFCDIVIASDRARFGLPEIKMGLFPPLACVYFPRIVGQKRAREMVLTGSLLSAAEAQQIGLVSYVVPDDQIAAKTSEVLDRFRSLSASVLETARRALVEASGLPIEEGLARVEDIYLNQLMSLKDPGEGLIAFREKRAPNWKHK
ncbi:MAG TPA: enoyl-CoA hydratase-related protein [Blastocatellia bacterium]|nr:enoyl-CoA hydratase-related protein [Blastocatellia bacterium]